MKKIFLFIGIFAMLSVLTLKAQVTIGVNQAPDSSAVLDLQSKGNLGMLLPRVELTDTLLASPLHANVPGMMVYNTTASADGKVVEGVYINDGHRWWPANGGVAGPWDLSGTTTAAKLNTQDIYQTGRVTIGMDTLQQVTMFNVVSDNKGIMIPRMTKDQRDAIDTTNANSLMVYNTDEDCYNYYSKSAGEWQSLCGKMGKATIDSVDCSGIQVFGNYIQGVATTVNERIVIPVNVLKEGSYDATVLAMFDSSTPNGYSFTASGTFLYTGPQTITLTAQGTPKQAHFDSSVPPTVGDNIMININGTDFNGCSQVIIPVIPAAADYDISCGSAVVNGIYTMAPDQTNSDDATHYISVNVNVNDLGLGSLATTGWSAETNKVSGVQFRGSGNFSSTGSKTINLYAVAGTKPTTLNPITLTMTFQTKNGSVDCQVTLRAAYTPKKIVVFGLADGTYNYALNGGDPQGFLSSQANFGSTNNSTVKMVTEFTAPAGYTKYGAFSYRHVSGDGSAVNTTSNWTQILSEKPDIVIFTYNVPAIISDEIPYIMQYLNAGGILLQFTESDPTLIVSAIFGVPQSTLTAARYGNGEWLTLGNYTDPILNGPFQPADPNNPGQNLKSLGGLRIFGDTEPTLYGIAGLPGSGIVIYGYNNQSTAGIGLGSVSAFRTTGQRYCFFGEGGFFTRNTADGTPGANIEPFVTTGSPNYQPAPRIVNAGDTYYQYQQTAPYSPGYNSFYFGNMIAWAIDQAQFYGINTQ